MVLLTTTPQILECISTLSPTQRYGFGDELPSDLTAPVLHSVLISLAKQSSRHATLNSLLRGTMPYVAPPPPKPEPSPEYKALMSRLRAEEEQREYNALLTQRPQDHLADGEDEDPVSPSLVLNIFISIVCCAMAVFYASRWLFSDGLRVLLALAAGVLVGVAEVVVYAAYLRNVKQSKLNERQKREQKSVVGEYKGPAVETTRDAVLVSTQKELIWGRGKHGGARRRVRERWEKQQDQDN